MARLQKGRTFSISESFNRVSQKMHRKYILIIRNTNKKTSRIQRVSMGIKSEQIKITIRNKRTNILMQITRKSVRTIRNKRLQNVTKVQLNNILPARHPTTNQ